MGWKGVSNRGVINVMQETVMCVNIGVTFGSLCQ